MQESDLHFIWHNNLFHSSNLITTSGETVKILKVGYPNTNQGPDFLLASVQIGHEVLYGNIEIHIRNSNWYEHGHHLDNRYNTTILHVVFEHTDAHFTHTQVGKIQILCLEQYIESKTLEHINTIRESKNDIPCEKIFQMPTLIKIQSFRNRIFYERVIRKSLWIKEIIQKNGNDYESALYQTLFSGFGIPVNKDIFLEIATSLPYSILQKNGNDLENIEALILGQSNLLHAMDAYSENLKSRFSYLKTLYSLDTILAQPLRARLLPPSAPTIRLVQFASLIFHIKPLYSKFIYGDVTSIVSILKELSLSPYWTQHYDFGKEWKVKKYHQLSSEFIHRILINVVLPFRLMLSIDNDTSVEEILEQFTQIPAENNVKTRKLTHILQLLNKNAQDSQSLIEWYDEFCTKKQCLACPIGLETLRP